MTVTVGIHYCYPQRHAQPDTLLVICRRWIRWFLWWLQEHTKGIMVTTTGRNYIGSVTDAIMIPINIVIIIPIISDRPVIPLITPLFPCINIIF